MNGRFWTEAEDQYLREHYHSMPVVGIARELNRNVVAIYNRVWKLGIQTRKTFLSDEILIDAIRRYSVLGWSDNEIKQELVKRYDCPANRHRIGNLRRSLEIPSQALSPRRRGLVSAKTREQLDKAGLESLSQVRINQWNEWKRSLGWPETLTIRAVQSAEMFYRRGPMTRMQLCAALGIDKKTRLDRTEPKCNAKGGTVLAELAAAGMVMRLRKQVPSGRDRRGGVRLVDLYMLIPGVSPNVETRKHVAAS